MARPNQDDRQRLKRLAMQLVLMLPEDGEAALAVLDYAREMAADLIETERPAPRLALVKDD